MAGPLSKGRGQRPSADLANEEPAPGLLRTVRGSLGANSRWVLRSRYRHQAPRRSSRREERPPWLRVGRLAVDRARASAGTAGTLFSVDGQLSDAELDELVEQATVDAYDGEEQLTGFFTMLAEQLAVPFKTVVLGVEVTVKKVDLLPGSRIVAVCKRGRHRQAIGILDLPLPDPAPAGAEWIEAYRHWGP